MSIRRAILSLVLVLTATYVLAQKPDSDQKAVSDQKTDTEQASSDKTTDDGQKSGLDWNWRSQEVIGRTDTSVGNTSKLTEPERTALIDAIVLRLQKPMGEAGYDDQRIHEIASISRVRFIDLGDGKPVLFTTSLGLEGGCDAFSKCPLWIFRRDPDGFLSLLDGMATSYTIQATSTNGLSDLVLMHPISAKESGLTLYKYADGKYHAAGCYLALWPKPTGDDQSPSDPEIQPCTGEATEAQPAAEVKQETPAVKPEPQAGEPQQELPVNKNTEPAPTPEAPQEKKEAPAQPQGEQSKEAPQSEQAQPQTNEAQPQSQPTTPPAEQPAPEQQPAQPTPEAPQPQGEQPKEAPQSEQAQPQTNEAQPQSQPTTPPAEQPPPEQQPAQPTPEAPQGEQPKEAPPAEENEPQANQAPSEPNADAPQTKQETPEQPAEPRQQAPPTSPPDSSPK